MAKVYELRGTFGVLDDHTFAYVDMTASGIETTAHLRENGRVCVMFCSFDSFDGTPNVVRLHGRGTEARGVITVDVARVADACGYAVPRMELTEDRELLDSWAERKTPSTLRDYRAEKNTVSLDGLPGLAGLPPW